MSLTVFVLSDMIPTLSATENTKSNPSSTVSTVDEITGSINPTLIVSPAVNDLSLLLALPSLFASIKREMKKMRFALQAHAKVLKD